MRIDLLPYIHASPKLTTQNMARISSLDEECVSSEISQLLRDRRVRCLFGGDVGVSIMCALRFVQNVFKRLGFFIKSRKV